MKHIIPLLYICFLSCAVIPGLGYAQTDTTKVKMDSLTSKKTSTPAPIADDEEANMSFGEIELMEITIEAIIEKPRVSILPKRQEPKLEEMEFIDRSFDKELKKGPDKPMMVDDRMKEPDKIERIISKIKKKRQHEKSSDK